MEFMRPFTLDTPLDPAPYQPSEKVAVTARTLAPQVPGEPSAETPAPASITTAAGEGDEQSNAGTFDILESDEPLPAEHEQKYTTHERDSHEDSSNASSGHKQGAAFLYFLILFLDFFSLRVSVNALDLCMSVCLEGNTRVICAFLELTLFHVSSFYFFHLVNGLEMQDKCTCLIFSRIFSSFFACCERSRDPR